MARVFLLVLDSFGIGAAPDAADFGDVGADTFGHIAEWCAKGHIAPERTGAGPLYVPYMADLGLAEASFMATGRYPEGFSPLKGQAKGFFGACAEQSRGKDTPSGHWEMAGLPVRFDWGYFPPDFPSFPKSLTDDLIREGALPGLLGNCHASGTEIIAKFGDEHIKTGKPIVYTSSDSVFQIAAHETYFGLERLYALCDIARRLVDSHNIGRVIARPFTGEQGHFERTANRRDYATPPHGDTLLDHLKQAGRSVISLGKIADIFAHRGFSEKIKAAGQEALFDKTLELLGRAPDGSLCFVNFVNFDQDFGHRRNIAGYAAALEAFDKRLPELSAKLRAGDMVILTADHGCDPSWPGSDHTREFVPFLAFGPGLNGGALGLRDSFADIGQTIAKHLGIAPLSEGHAAF